LIHSTSAARVEKHFFDPANAFRTVRTEVDCPKVP
jgi:hypothetical protein